MDARFNLLRLGALTIGDVRYGAEVTLGYEHPDAYQVGVPVAGRLEARQGGRPIVGEGCRAPLFRVGEEVVIGRWGADCRQLGVKINRVALEQQLTSLLDAPVETPILFAAGLDIAAGLGRSWAAMIRLVAAEFGNDTGLLREPLIVRQLQDSLTMGLLLAIDHPRREALTRRTAAYRPQPVRRAVDAIQASPESPFTLAELAAAAGVGVRALQAGFQRYLGCTPMAYLRHVRLARVHDELRAADPRRTTVTEIAYRWGFAHLGRFAAAYRSRYGASPRETLQQW
ncbi:AraC-type DNA-binding protein [Paractinoplanes atraurantiacus]|uniref:AraC-type DNA-binding protein n=1 Tax=Paractinoplanes atraurantiacus TaxID=1036182 RepID=A0A285JGQ0_9ACTN|nr:AraC-type DNA-binding protein [Actinoplanes atraurantiacus]